MIETLKEEKMEEYILHKGTAVMKIPLSKIYYVTMHPIKSHTAVFVTIDGEFEKAITLSKLEELSTGGLIRCHRKFLVNKSKIVGLDYETRTIMFADKRISDINCSRRCFAFLKKEWINAKVEV